MKRNSNQGPPENIVLVQWFIYITIGIIFLWVSGNTIVLLGNQIWNTNYELFTEDYNYWYGWYYFLLDFGVLSCLLMSILGIDFIMFAYSTLFIAQNAKSSRKRMNTICNFSFVKQLTNIRKETK